jgi:hypothetical protein
MWNWRKTIREQTTSGRRQGSGLLDAAKSILDAGQLEAYAKFLVERRPAAIMSATPFFARQEVAD